jgi:hypothetical protein
MLILRSAGASIIREGVDATFTAPASFFAQQGVASRRSRPRRKMAAPKDGQ